MPATAAILEQRQEQIHRTGEAPFAITCDKESLAGAVSQRACVFCGSRVALYPIADALHLVHGPIGCAVYTWDIRGALSSGPELHRLSFSTDLQEMDVIFGGEKKLYAALCELINLAGELWLIRDYYQRIGIEVVANITGDGRIADIQRAHGAALNVVQCSGATMELAQMMEADFNIPFQRVSCFGVEDMAESLYSVARRLGIPLVRVGFPIHDRMGGQRLLHLGYHGAQRLFDEIVNTLIAKRQDGSAIGYSYM